MSKSPKRVISYDIAEERANNDSYFEDSNEFPSNLNTKRNLEV